MRVKNKVVYITEDGYEFENIHDAEEHENRLMLFAQEILKKEQRVNIGRYEILTLNNKNELEVLVNQEYGEHFNHIPDDVVYPIKIAISNVDYYFTYELLEDAIERDLYLCDVMKKELKK